MTMPKQLSIVRQFILATMLCCAFEVLAPPAQAQPGAGAYRIAGRVVSSTSGAPLPQSRVTIASVQDRGQTLLLITGADGTFDFKGLPAGKYSLSAARRGFIESSYNQHERYSTAIVTGGDADSEHLVFRLTPQAVLTGKVLDEVGDPVRRAQVSLYVQDQTTGVSRVRRMANSRTDDRGLYEFAELPAGTYFISVNARPWYAVHPHSQRVGEGSVEPPAADHSFDVTYPTTYYPDTTDSDDASPIPLRGGEHMSVDIHLTPVPSFRIVVGTPRIPGSPDQGFSMPILLKKSFDSRDNVTAMLLGANSDPSDEQRTSNFVPLGDGTIELTGIPPGKYTVFVPDSGGGSTPGGISEVDITQNGQQLDPSSGEPVSSLKFQVQVVGERQPPQQLAIALRNDAHRVVLASPVDAKGESTLVNVPPGKYDLIAATPNMNYAVTQIATNGSTKLGHTLEIAAGSTIEGTVTLVAGTGTVRGFAKRGGKGVAGAMVVLVPSDPEVSDELFRRDQSDLDGSFSLPNVIPGQYTIVAIEDGWDLDWSKPGVIAHYLPKGHKVTVAAAAHTTVDLPVPLEVQSR
jgi:Carboxypeptidase regulatory-like domain